MRPNRSNAHSRYTGRRLPIMPDPPRRRDPNCRLTPTLTLPRKRGEGTYRTPAVMPRRR